MNNRLQTHQNLAPNDDFSRVAQSQKSWVNAVLFQGAWLGVVYLSSMGQWEASLLLTASVLVVHFLWLSENPRLDLRILVGLSLLGSLIDGVVALSGLLLFSPLESSPRALLPIWIPQLWLLFATTPRVSLRSLVGKPWLGASLAALSAPFTYGVLGGSWQLSSYGEPLWLAIGVHGGLWALLFWNLRRGILFLNRSLKTR